MRRIFICFICCRVHQLASDIRLLRRRLSLYQLCLFWKHWSLEDKRASEGLMPQEQSVSKSHETMTLVRMLLFPSTPTYVSLESHFTLDDWIGIEIISMAKKPVNSLSTQILNELKTSLLEAQNSKIKGIILTSSLPTVFSAGLDIMEMYTTDKEKLANYWNLLQDTWMTLNSLTVPFAAAINVQSLSSIMYARSMFLHSNLIEHSFLHRVPVLPEVVC